MPNLEKNLFLSNWSRNKYYVSYFIYIYKVVKHERWKDSSKLLINTVRNETMEVNSQGKLQSSLNETYTVYTRPIYLTVILISLYTNAACWFIAATELCSLVITIISYCINFRINSATLV